MKTLSTVSNISVALAVLLPMLGGCAEKAAGPTVTTGKPSVRESNAPPTREADTPPVHSSIPFMATRSDAVRDMLWMAEVDKNDVVYDLGSGDGRIVIAAVRDFGARRAVGIEIDPARIAESRENARKAGVADRVEFIAGDLFTADIREASVVALFVGHGPNIRLRPRLFSMLKPGTRIVSHQFAMGEWQADKALTVHTVALGMWGEMASPFADNPHVPDYTGNEMHFGSNDRIAMWVVPARVGGIWRGKIDTAKGTADCQLTLHQRLSGVTGTFQLSGETNLAGQVHADLWGSNLRFECNPDKMAYGQFQLMFDGQVNTDSLRGTLAVTDRGQAREHAWEARRDKADFAGTWEWESATGGRAARLRIEQRDGRHTATYLDGDQTMPVTDFYDCGGGFYFTLLIGQEGDGLVITEDTGWLIGEGIVDRGGLKGTIAFHKYSNPFGAPSGEEDAQTVSRSWEPRLIKP